MNNIKPWHREALSLLDDENEGDEDRYYKLCESIAASDFYFSLDDKYEFGYVSVVIVPVEYLDKTGHLFDQYMGAEHVLPNYLHCATEAIWQTNKYDLNVVKSDLLNRGFRINKKLDKMIKNVLIS